MGEKLTIQKMGMFATKTPEELNKYIESISNPSEKRIAMLIYGLTWNSLAEAINNKGKKENLKDTKNIRNFKEAIKAQDLDVEHFRITAKSIAEELGKKHPHRKYVYEKVGILEGLYDY